MSQRIGILTGGGDAPGLNAVIRAVTVKAIEYGYEVVGFERGWAGLLGEGPDYSTPVTRVLEMSDVEDIHRHGGTVLFSSRTNPSKITDDSGKVIGYEIAKKHLDDLEIHALIAAGGDDTLGVALKLHEAGAKVVGAPKTIDNDVSGTDYTFGFDTAINRTMESLDRLQSTTVSHQRVTVVEIMGRHAGWIALHGGIAGGANWITIPEVEFDVKEIAEMIKARYAAGKKWALIAVAEGSIDPDLQRRIQHSAETDDFGHVQFSISQGVAKVVADELEELTGFESRHTVLGHLQRGGEPSAFDRVLGTRLGVKVVEMIRESNFGKMAAVQGGEGDHIVPVDLEVGVGTSKTVPLKDYEVAKLFFG